MTAQQSNEVLLLEWQIKQLEQQFLGSWQNPFESLAEVTAELARLSRIEEPASAEYSQRDHDMDWQFKFVAQRLADATALFFKVSALRTQHTEILRFQLRQRNSNNVNI